MKSLKFKPRQQRVLPGFRFGAFDMRVLDSEADRAAGFSLRLRAYEKYLTSAEIPENSEYKDTFDNLSTSLLIGAYDGEKLAGSMRLCFSRPWDTLATLPCGAYYPPLAALKAAARGSLMEVSRVAIDPAITNTSYRTTLYASLVRIGFIAAEAGGVSTILLATPEASERFYGKMLGFERIGEPALYPPGDFKITLLGGSMNQARLLQRTRNTFFRISPEEVSALRDVLTARMLVAEVA